MVKLDENPNIIMFPDFKKLKEEVEKLRTELSMSIFEHDELKYIICKNIETVYMMELGALEYKIFKEQCEVLKLRRKIELIQVKINHEEEVSISEIEKTLNDEFFEYQFKLNEYIEKMNEAIKNSKCRILSVEEEKELKNIYRKIVKILHPDINLNISYDELELFNNAVTAYKMGDLEGLRIIYEMIGNHELANIYQDAMEQLIDEKERLVEIINGVLENIKKIKAEYPYSMREIVEDEVKLKHKKEDLKAILKEYEKATNALNIKISEMLGDINHE